MIWFDWLSCVFLIIYLILRWKLVTGTMSEPPMTPLERIQTLAAAGNPPPTPPCSADLANILGELGRVAMSDSQTSIGGGHNNNNVSAVAFLLQFETKMLLFSLIKLFSPKQCWLYWKKFLMISRHLCGTLSISVFILESCLLTKRNLINKWLRWFVWRIYLKAIFI